QGLYQRETAPIIAVYKDRGLVVEVDALGAVDDVENRITAALAARGIGTLS
ncbi:MAG TPA: adenylate kinase, partial [Galbitalea sp.]|nr:adenylate kinase [Galbitalea sp.]